MRLALVSDIHANLPALSAVRDAIEAERVDSCLCAGDLVGYGPSPDDCVALVGELGWSCVAGNHDLIAIGALAGDRCTGLARTTLDWTRRTISAATRAALAALPPAVTDGPVHVAHGALGDPERYVTSDADAAAQLAALEREQPAARVLVLGHTHRMLAFAEAGGALLRDRAGSLELPPEGRLLVNPGSVGQTRWGPPLARFALLDLDAGRLEFREVGYDTRAVRRELRKQGLPADAYAPGRRGMLPRAVGRLRRRLEVRP